MLTPIAESRPSSLLLLRLFGGYLATGHNFTLQTKTHSWSHNSWPVARLAEGMGADSGSTLQRTPSHTWSDPWVLVTLVGAAFGDKVC